MIHIGRLSRTDGFTALRARWIRHEGTLARVALALAPLTLTVSACSSPPSVKAAAAPAAISKAYEVFFNFGKKSIPAKLAYVQDGPTVERALTRAVNSRLAGSIQGADVHKVTLLSSPACRSINIPWPCATVKYQMESLASGGGETPDNTGYAVYGSGVWLVAKATTCFLLDIFSQAESRSMHAPGCSAEQMFGAGGVIESG